MADILSQEEIGALLDVVDDMEETSEYQVLLALLERSTRSDLLANFFSEAITMLKQVSDNTALESKKLDKDMLTFMELVMSEIEGTIAGLTGIIPVLTLENTEELTVNATLDGPMVSVITSNMEQKGLLFIFPVRLATALVDLMMGGSGDGRDEIDEDGLDGIYEIVSFFIWSINSISQNTFSINTRSPILFENTVELANSEPVTKYSYTINIDSVLYSFDLIMGDGFETLNYFINKEVDALIPKTMATINGNEFLNNFTWMVRGYPFATELLQKMLQDYFSVEEIIVHVKENGNLMKYAPLAIRKDKEVLLASITSSSDAYVYSLYEDKDALLLELYKRQQDMRAYISRELALQCKPYKPYKQDSSWLQTLWNWAEVNDIDTAKFPRNEEELIGLTYLNLSFARISELPKEIGRLINLTELNLSNNYLSELPEEVDVLISAISEARVFRHRLLSLDDNLDDDFDLDDNLDDDSNENSLPETVQQYIKEYNNLTPREQKDRFTQKLHDSSIPKCPKLYELEEEDIFIKRLCQYASDARKNGILSLEEACDREPSVFIKPLLQMAIDGYEPDTIVQFAEYRGYGLVHAYENIPPVDKEQALKDIQSSKDSYINLLESISIDTQRDEIKNSLTEMQNTLLKTIPIKPIEKAYVSKVKTMLNLAITGVTNIQRGLNPDVLFETLDSKTFSKNSWEIVLQEEIIASDEELNEEIQEQLTQYLEDIQTEIQLENPQSLINRLVDYAANARRESILVLTHSIFRESNPALREKMLSYLISKKYAKNSKDFVKSYMDKLSSTDSYICYLYKKELLCIDTAWNSIVLGINPRTLENRLMALYPEEELKSLFG